MPETKEREKLAEVIRQWNSNRLDLFEISQPDENLVFHGVIRFYFEDHTEGSVATKCLRVCSSSSTREVIETLSEKFRPDIEKQSTDYSLYEIHKYKERKLDLDERPLVIQLNWTSNNREGQFVLRKKQESLKESCHEKEKGGVLQSFKKTLSRKGKKKERGPAKDDDKASEDSLESLKYCKEIKTNQMLEGFSDQSGLPVRITFCNDAEEPFLSAVINYTNSSTVHFKLSPAYILYAVSRSALQRQHRRGSPSSANTHAVTSITTKMAAMMGKVIQRQQAITGALAFWMANSSELLNFLKHDKDLTQVTQQSQLGLSHQVHNAYSFLLHCLQSELRKHLPTFLIDPKQHGALPAGIEMVLDTLMNVMSLLRRCRVNPALTIQLFSQLFHFISARLFNQLMVPETNPPGLRSHYWGSALRQRLTPIEAWAERQGLELAADCHLGHIVQATTLLTMKKYSLQDAKDIQSSCFKLNSLQLRMLMAGYFYGTSEPQIPPDLMDAVVKAAEASADNLIHSEGCELRLEESLDLLLPFLLPEGGYSCDTVRGIPQGLREFLEPICQKGLCCLTSVPHSQGAWTAYFSESTHNDGDLYLAVHRQPEIENITLHKPLNSGMGVSIVAAKGAGQSNLGIYIKSVVKGGPAEMNGSLAAGDQLLSVDGHSLVGLSQDRAAAIMMKTGPVVTLKVEKFAASYHGLLELLNEPPPENKTSKNYLSGGENAKLNNAVSTLYCVVDLSPSERLHGGSETKKDQRIQKNRQLFCSNPNMTAGFCLEDGGELVDPDVRGNNLLSISSVNLCADRLHREYLTLPNPKSLKRSVFELGRPTQPFIMAVTPSNEPSSSRRVFVRQAMSQENLCMDTRGPLLDQRQNTCAHRNQNSKQSSSYCLSFPIRSSVSTHDILSDHSGPTKPLRGSCPSPAGVWRTPFSQQSTPIPSAQPIRIDIPITRAGSTQSNPPLTTFQQSSSVDHKVSEQKKNAPSQVSHISACPLSPKKLFQPSILWQQRSTVCGDRVEKPQVSITPTKHVSFQVTLSKQTRSCLTNQKRTQVLCNPWRREAQEMLEKQQRLQAVELLEQEVQQLQATDKRSAEENDRLRRLDLEWRFQKRLQEIQQRGDEEEEEEDLDMMVILQQLGDRTSKDKDKISYVGNANREQNEEEKQAGNRLSNKQKEAKNDQIENGLNNIASDENLVENIKRVSAPEKLTFRERQHLFSLTSSA
ncbi:afadin isoform X3 [Girardinichthys multiradiatus]|uniref:afadin isoform X3 n=1 Tax=Girardinichthys multiradiatus TaxID=208333 RepID=UPI001FAD001C|nr:afadin isoform X3 [Girardinichthys multiradiatus]